MKSINKKIRASLFVFSFSFFTLFSFSFFTLQAQTPSNELKFDSLVKVNGKYTQQNEIKLALLNQLTLGYSDIDPAKGIIVGEEAIQLAQKLNEPILLAEAYNNKALSLVLKGLYPQAFELYEQAIAINKANNNVFGLATNNLNIGYIYRNKNEKEKALSYMESSLLLFESNKSKQGIAKAYHFIAGVYADSYECDSALKYYQKSEIIHKQIGHKKGLALNYLGLGIAYECSGELSKSIDNYQKGLAIAEKLGLKNTTAATLQNIGNVYYNNSDYNNALEYYKKARNLNEQTGNAMYLANNYIMIGNVYSHFANYTKTLEYFQKGLTIYEKLGNKKGIATINGNIGILYYDINNFIKAFNYFNKALSMSEEIAYKRGVAENLGNLANVYSNLNEEDGLKLGFTKTELQLKALENYKKAIAIDEELGLQNGLALNIQNVGNTYLELTDSACKQIGIKPADRYVLAMEYYQKALEMRKGLDRRVYLANNYRAIGSLYRDAPDYALNKWGIKLTDRYIKAIEYIDNGLHIAEEVSDVNEQKFGWLNLSIAYEKQGDFSKAYTTFQRYVVLRDSTEGAEVKKNILQKEKQYDFEVKETALVYNQQITQEKLIQSQQEARLGKQALQLSNKEKSLQRLAYLQTQAALRQQKIIGEKQLVLNEKKDADLKLLSKEKDLKQTELELSQAEVQSKNQQRNGFIIGSALLFLLAGAIFIGLRKTANEKQKSEKLLLNILPAEVAQELKNTGESVAKQYNHVSVLFTDFVNFTGLSEQMSATELVQEIHKNFTAFDAIMERHGIEKIKTIGDAYLAVCGLPHEVEDHAQRITMAAIEIREFMDTNHGKFQIRIGINSGSVVAGIVGVKKFAYDIWGDTVNMASRLESNSEAGKINVSKATYELISKEFECEHRGKIHAKGKGEIDMWFVEGKK